MNIGAGAPTKFLRRRTIGGIDLCSGCPGDPPHFKNFMIDHNLAYSYYPPVRPSRPINALASRPRPSHHHAHFPITNTLYPSAPSVHPLPLWGQTNYLPHSNPQPSIKSSWGGAHLYNHEGIHNQTRCGRTITNTTSNEGVRDIPRITKQYTILRILLIHKSNEHHELLGLWKQNLDKLTSDKKRNTIEYLCN